MKTHNDLIDMFEACRSLFAMIIFGHFLSAAITICCGSLGLLIGSGYGLLIFAFYCGCVLSQLFIYCYGGTKIAEESEKIVEAVYFSHWYRADPKIRKMLLLLMTRAHRPVLMSVPFFTPSLSAFSSVRICFSM